MVKFWATIIAIVVFVHILCLVPMYWAKGIKQLYMIPMFIFFIDSMILPFFVAGKVFNWDYKPFTKYGTYKYADSKELLINGLITVSSLLAWLGLTILTYIIFENFSYYK